MVVPSVSAWRSPSLNEDATDTCRTSAEICAFPHPRYQAAPRLPDDMGPIYRRLIEATFPARSRHQCCKDAAKALGCGPDAVERILTGYTQRADARVILACMVLYEHRTKEPFPLIPGLMAHLIEVRP